MADDERLGVSGDAVLHMLDGMGTRLDQGFSRIEAKLDTKADKTDVARINVVLDEHGREIGLLKDRAREDEAADRALSDLRNTAQQRSQRLWNFLLSVALVSVTLFGVLAAVFPLVTRPQGTPIWHVALLAFLAMCTQDVLATVMVIFESHFNAAAAGLFDVAGYLATLTCSVLALDSILKEGWRSRRSLVIIGSVSAANFLGTVAGVSIGAALTHH